MISFENPFLYVGLIALVCVVAVLAIVGPKLKNSPWLYVTAFGLMSCLGILAIKPKFDQRERGIEAKYAGRVASNEYLSKKTQSHSVENKAEQGSKTSTDKKNVAGPIYILPPDQNGKTVDFLLVICGLATIVGTGMLVYTVQHPPGNQELADPAL